LRTLDSARSVEGAAIVSLTTATECCHELRTFDLFRSPSVEWIGFKPNPAMIAKKKREAVTNGGDSLSPPLVTASLFFLVALD